jgi:hypothetical protein
VANIYLQIPEEDVVEILLDDGWHRPDPETLYIADSRIFISTATNGASADAEIFGREIPVVCWEETNQQRTMCVIVRRSVVMAIRCKSDVLDEQRIGNARIRLNPLQSQPERREEMRRLQRGIARLRRRSPNIAENPLDTQTP